MAENPRPLNIAFAFFSYSGNGGISCHHPSLRTWWGETLKYCKAHDQVADVIEFDLSDTPVTMTRNRAVTTARAEKADVLVMVDSDNQPDLYLGKDADAQPFISSSLEFLLSRYDRKLTCIAAPYCGPPPDECVYAFQFTSQESDCPPDRYKLSMVSREQAAIMSGLHPAAAAATGVLMTDMRCFDMTEPRSAGDKPWFYYEYSDHLETEKRSTEDVVFTRNLAITCQSVHGYNPLFVNWSAWAGHWKSKCVGKPRPMSVENVHENLRRAMDANHKPGEKLVYFHAPLEPLPQDAEFV